jgi:hypothetical protein
MSRQRPHNPSNEEEKPVKSKKVYFAPFAAALLLLSGCMSGGGVKDEDNAVLRTRSVERWDMLIGHKAEKAWDYLTPGYRETKPRAAYADEMNHRGMRWNKVAFDSQECDVDTCKVHLLVNYNLDMGGLAGKVASAAPVVETWIKVNGRWYFLPEQFQPTKLGKDS